MEPELIIRISTMCALAGLLLAVGLRLTFPQVTESVKSCRFSLILAVNFLAVPLVCALAARWAGLSRDSTTALVLLGAAPFAPVVPVFARMARADIALAAGLTSIYPVISAFLTPWVCELILGRAAGVSGVQFSSTQVMLMLVATITLPLLAGIALELTRNVRLDFHAGLAVAGELEWEDSSGHDRIEQEFDAAPLVGGSLQLLF